jgi:hypothetical protein
MKQSKTSFTIRVMVACFALSIFSRVLPAEDFTVIVPVELKNLPAELVQFTVSCGASADDGTPIGTGHWTGEQYIEPTMYDIVGGNYSGTITVKFNALIGRDPRLATRITAYLEFKKTGQQQLGSAAYFLGTSGLYARIDMTQPYLEYTTASIVNH